jgi:prophage maintenance system killer protein
VTDTEWLDAHEAPLAEPLPESASWLLPTALFDEAAEYAFRLCAARSFHQGSKRASLMAARMFLGMLGWSLAESNRPLSEALVAVAAGTLGHPALAAALERRFHGDSVQAPSPSLTSR